MLSQSQDVARGHQSTSIGPMPISQSSAHYLFSKSIPERLCTCKRLPRTPVHASARPTQLTSLSPATNGLFVFSAQTEDFRIPRDEASKDQCDGLTVRESLTLQPLSERVPRRDASNGPAVRRADTLKPLASRDETHSGWCCTWWPIPSRRART